MEPEELVSKVAEYLSIAPHLTEFDNDERYRRANELALELAVWLDADLYIEIGQSVGYPSAACNPGTVIIHVRQRYGHASKLSQDNIIVHAPGIGKKGNHE